MLFQRQGHTSVQGLISAPMLAKKQSAEGGDTTFWDRPGAQGVAKQLQSTELALPGGRKAETPATATAGVAPM